jgi:DNA polymerase-1
VLARQGHDVLIVSSDKDFAQIVNQQIKILLPPPTANPKLGWQVRDEAGVREKFGVPPSQIADFLALVGDTSDNIPGVKGIGEKTALELVNQYASLDDLYAGLEAVKIDRVHPRLWIQGGAYPATVVFVPSSVELFICVDVLVNGGIRLFAHLSSPSGPTASTPA